MVKIMGSSFVLCLVLALLAHSCIINNVHAGTIPTATGIVQEFVKIESEHPPTKSSKPSFSRKGVVDPERCCGPPFSDPPCCPCCD
ncbi:hypothetical protein Scep_020262 [Stephania cephalantha]|uniref:Hepcidin n=1 Tax=Stephania cephalantha TaxID=152367 RepID=A0AAP0ICV6_9MAGN